MSDISFSIVCPTYQGENNLIALIACLDANFKNLSQFPEIIFIIDNSSDSSQILLEEFEGKNPEKKITIHKNTTNLGPAQSRNIGVQMASGTVILFLDDDCRPKPNWYLEITSAWRSAEEIIQGIGGYVVPTELESFNGRYCSTFSPIKPWPLIPSKISLPQRVKQYYKTPSPISQGVSYLAGANMSFRKDAFVKVGGFSPKLRIAEDISICMNLRSTFGDDCLRVFESLTMPHNFSGDFKTMVRRSYRYGNGSGKNFSRGNGSFSFNPGPILILSFLLLFLTCHLILGASIRDALSRSLVFFPLEILFYAFFVTRDKSALPRFFIQRIKLGLAFLVSETANSVGFISGLRFLFAVYREYS